MRTYRANHTRTLKADVYAEKVSQYLPEIFEKLARDGKKTSHQNIADYLNSKGILTRRKNEWNRKTVKDLFKRLKNIPGMKNKIISY